MKKWNNGLSCLWLIPIKQWSQESIFCSFNKGHGDRWMSSCEQFCKVKKRKLGMHFWMQLIWEIMWWKLMYKPSRLPNSWPNSGNVHLLPLFEIWLEDFSSSEYEVVRVVPESPWSFRGDVLVLYLIPWQPNFRSILEQFQSAPAWIHLQELPVEYWHVKGVLRLDGEGKVCVGLRRVGSFTPSEEAGSLVGVCERSTVALYLELIRAKIAVHFSSHQLIH